MIELLRIDDRLVHGQVVEGWIPHLKADHVIVVSEQAAADDTQQALMRLALPDSVELEVFAVREAAAYLNDPETNRARLLVLVPGPQEALQLLEAGVTFKSLNVGGLHYSAGRIQLGRVIFLSDDDRRTLRELAARGVVLEGRAVPTDRKMDIAGMLAAGV